MNSKEVKSGSHWTRTNSIVAFLCVPFSIRFKNHFFRFLNFVFFFSFPLGRCECLVLRHFPERDPDGILCINISYWIDIVVDAYNKNKCYQRAVLKKRITKTSKDEIVCTSVYMRLPRDYISKNWRIFLRMCTLHSWFSYIQHSGSR